MKKLAALVAMMGMLVVAPFGALADQNNSNNSNNPPTTSGSGQHGGGGGNGNPGQSGPGNS